MNFNLYDDFGRRINQESQSSSIPVRVSNTTTITTNIVDANDSDIESEVEIIEDDNPMDDLSVPLVHTTGPSAASSKEPLMIVSKDETPSETNAREAALNMLAESPGRQRVVALVGQLHHGKSSVAEGLLGCFRKSFQDSERGITTRSDIFTSLMYGVQTKSTHLMTIIDTPGHPDFFSDAAAALRIADVAVLCIDCTDIVTAYTESLIRQIVLHENISLMVILTKIDRLVIDLHIPPKEAYQKLNHIIDSINNVIFACGMSRNALVSPLSGTVCFSSATLGLFFSLDSFARKYSMVYKGINPEVLKMRLWGPVHYDAKSKIFVKLTRPTQTPSFVSFILDSIYKIIAQSITGRAHSVLSDDLSNRPKGPIVAAKESINYFCGNFREEAFDAIVVACPTASRRDIKLKNMYGYSPTSNSTTMAVSTLAVDGENEVLSVCRVLHGELRPEVQFALITREGDDASVSGSVESLYLRTPKGLVSITRATPGMIVCVRGSLSNILQHPHALLVAPAEDEENDGATLLFNQINASKPLTHVSIEPVAANRRVQLVEGLRKVQMVYPGTRFSVEDTGAFTLTAHGELQYECALHDLRAIYCKAIPLRLTSPFITFAETVDEKEGVLAAYPQTRPQMTMIANKLEQELCNLIEYEHLPTSGLYTVLRKEIGWDALASRRGILALGPDVVKGPSLLVDDSIDGSWGGMAHCEEAARAQENLFEGFRSAMAQGPLCGENVRGVRLTLIEKLSALERCPGFADNIMDWTKQCALRALLGGNPRLMEPVVSLDITTPARHISTLRDILAGGGTRRGTVVSEVKIPATTLVMCRALVPLIDHFGIETQIRMLTNGEAFPLQQFSQWDTVPGDPYDSSVVVPITGVARGSQLARDFVLKTRTRKGLKVNPEDWGL